MFLENGVTNSINIINWDKCYIIRTFIDLNVITYVIYQMMHFVKSL